MVKPKVADGNMAASHARQITGDDPDKKGYLGLPGWGLSVGLTTPPRENIFVTKLQPRHRNGN